MLKGGVIMDVMNVEQAKIAEKVSPLKNARDIGLLDERFHDCLSNALRTTFASFLSHSFAAAVS